VEEGRKQIVKYFHLIREPGNTMEDAMQKAFGGDKGLSKLDAQWRDFTMNLKAP